MRTTVLVRPSLRFTGLAALVLGVCFAITRSALFARNPDVAAWGITFDLTITLPALYWLVVVRRGHARPLTVAPVFLLGSLAAAWLLPPAQRHFLAQMKTVVGGLAEVVLLGAMAWRVAKYRRSDSADPYLRIHAAAKTFAGDGRVATIIASEATLFYYALFSWRKRPEDDPQAITFHERNGWSVILSGLLLAIAAEGIAMHLFLASWKPAIAWLWTALDVWAAFWLIGDFHALRLRRTTVDDTTLHLRYGMRWTAEIPLASIASVTPIRTESEWKKKGVLKVAMLDEPKWLLTLQEPIVVHGLAGLEKRIEALALLPDQELPAPLAALANRA